MLNIKAEKGINMSKDVDKDAKFQLKRLAKEVFLEEIEDCIPKDFWDRHASIGLIVKQLGEFMGEADHEFGTYTDEANRQFLASFAAGKIGMGESFDMKMALKIFKKEKKFQ